MGRRGRRRWPVVTPEPHPAPPSLPADAAAVSVGSHGGPVTWEGTLSALEGDVARLEEAVRASHGVDEFAILDTDWVPPTGLGPLPDHLRERAELLSARQLAVAEALIHDITWSRRQRDVAARLSRTQARPTAAFIDDRC